MVDVNEIKDKSPHILAGLGALFILLHSLDAFKQYLFLDKLASIGRIAEQYLFQDFFDSILENFVSSIFGVLLTAIIGLLIGLLLIVYIVRIVREPTKRDYIMIIVFGVIGLLMSSAVGGILVIIAGVIGIKRYP